MLDELEQAPISKAHTPRWPCLEAGASERPIAGSQPQGGRLRQQTEAQRGFAELRGPQQQRQSLAEAIGHAGAADRRFDAPAHRAGVAQVATGGGAYEAHPHDPLLRRVVSHGSRE